MDAVHIRLLMVGGVVVNVRCVVKDFHAVYVVNAGRGMNLGDAVRVLNCAIDVDDGINVRNAIDVIGVVHIVYTLHVFSVVIVFAFITLRTAK